MQFASPSLICVNPKEAADHWPLASEFVRSAIERTELSDFEEVKSAVLRGELLLWIAIQGHEILGAGVTQQLKDTVVIVAWGGKDRARWKHLVNRIEDYAAAEGCKSVRIYGRKGWERVLNGYGATHVILEKRL